jgi:hypothetical protein
VILGSVRFWTQSTSDFPQGMVFSTTGRHVPKNTPNYGFAETNSHLVDNDWPPANSGNTVKSCNRTAVDAELQGLGFKLKNATTTTDKFPLPDDATAVNVWSLRTGVFVHAISICLKLGCI